MSNAWGNSWVWGNARYDTNTANITSGVLFPEVGSAEVYRCPADNSPVTDRPDLRRFRSYSAQAWLNVHFGSGAGIEGGVNDDPQNLRSLSQIVKPPPVRTFVFTDEHPQSIGDGVFGIPEGGGWWGASMPADRHDQGCNLSFADGHVEHWRWLSPKNGMSEGNPQAAANPQDLKDLERLQEAVPRP